jgi:hypothetical protein
MVSTERRAARGVANHMNGTVEAKADVMDKLGLIDIEAPRDLNGRRVVIESSDQLDTAPSPVGEMDNSMVVMRRANPSMTMPASDRSAVPEGLRNLTPVGGTGLRKIPQSAEDKVGPRGGRHKPGTKAGRAWHQKQRIKTLCEPCRIYYNQCAREARAEKKAQAESEKAVS